uniref:Hemicentin-1 n=1 Tax=Panagrellus redivivus TaxID=6233 RepID=A0A7E4ZV76_PANRE
MSLHSNDSAIKRFTYDWLIRFAELHPFLLNDSPYGEVRLGVFKSHRSKYAAISPLFTTVIVRYMPYLFYSVCISIEYGLINGWFLPNSKRCSIYIGIRCTFYKLTPVPQWSAWSPWSKCSCFTLTQFRRRFCAIRDPVIQGFCPGGIIDQRKCQPENCVAEAGGWSDWSSWSACSKECGSTGHQIRNRMCSNPLPSNRGSYCVGYSFDQRPCDTPMATCSGPPRDGGWSDWAAWSECSNPCENGQMSRTRYCTNPRPANGGSQCLGSDFELKSCSDSEKCEKSSNGAWAPWTSWSECSATCGRAFRHRSRTCSAPTPAGNGTTCVGLAYVTSVCKTEPCPHAIDGRWSTWTPWSDCKGDCNGTGTRTRRRLCSTPSFGGNTCLGRSYESVPCTPDALLSDDSYCSSARRHEQALESSFVTRPLR